MENARYVASLPFIIVGVVFTALGILIIHLGYLVGGQKSDPFDLFDERNLSETSKLG